MIHWLPTTPRAMKRSHRTSSVVVAALFIAMGCGFLMPKSATAAVPSPVDSNVPKCLNACPLGDIVYHVVIRDIAVNPIPGSTVVLNFSACTMFPYCGGASTSFQVDTQAKTIFKTTDMNGVADFPLPLEGSCVGMSITVFADGVNMGNARLVFLDQDDDETVSDADIALVGSKVGTGDLTGDVNCSGFVTTDDVDFIAAHRGHACPRTTPIRHSHWGRLRILYR